MERAVSAYYNDPSATSKHSLPKNSSLEKLLAIFDKYKDPQTEIILIDGTLAYLEDLDIDPENCLSLILAWLLKSPQTGEFHRNDFVQAWAQAGVTDITQMKSYIEAKHQKLISSPTEFANLYNFVFVFIKDADPRVKLIDYLDAISYWQLLFAQCLFFTPSSKRLEQWYSFVEESKRGISRDLWEMFYKFVLEVINTDPENLSDYDEMSAWHSMMDEFVEWLEDSSLLTR